MPRDLAAELVRGLEEGGLEEGGGDGGGGGGEEERGGREERRKEEEEKGGKVKEDEGETVRRTRTRVRRRGRGRAEGGRVRRGDFCAERAAFREAVLMKQTLRRESGRMSALARGCEGGNESRREWKGGGDSSRRGVVRDGDTREPGRGGQRGVERKGWEGKESQ